VRRNVLIGVALLASGCTSGLLESDAPPDRIYTLRAQEGSVPAGTSRLDAKIKVALPRVAPGLDSDRIAVRTGQHALDYYRAARWGDTAAKVVQSFVVDSLRASGAFALVVPEASPVATDYLLDLELSEFHADQAAGGAPTAHVRIVATLIDTRDRRAIAAFESDAVVVAQADRLGAVADAMERAAGETTAAMATRLAREIGDRAIAGAP